MLLFTMQWLKQRMYYGYQEQDGESTLTYFSPFSMHQRIIRSSV